MREAKPGLAPARPLREEDMTDQSEPGTRPGKNLSVRLPGTHLDIVNGLAQIDGVTMGEVIRHAVLAYGEMRRQQPEFRDQVDRAKRQLDAVLTVSGPSS
ncbi:MAG: hypothetical protein LC789_14595 [Actinobacteria bacterium]|nr:hypothetical protein [Actinomycetota bacterium]MCA1721335.1 hypothetical protein [Actinomycetota bacterium]